MDKATQRRWIILLSALLLTVGAIFYPLDNETIAVFVPRPSATTKKTIPAILSGPSLVSASSASEIDPFAPRGWQGAPLQVVEPPKVAAVVVQAAPPLEPPGPPPLPFKFVGRMSDNGDQLVYLGRGDQALIARIGETLEGTYKVLSIEAQRIEFEYLPSGEKQALSLPVSDN